MAKTLYRTSMEIDIKYKKEVSKFLKKRHVPFLMEEFDGRLYVMYMSYDWAVQTELNKMTQSRATLNGKEVTD